MKDSSHLFGFHALQTVLRLKPSSVHHVFILDNRGDKRAIEIETEALAHNIPVTRLAKNKMDERFVDSVHQGFAAEVSEIQYVEHDLPLLLEALEKSALFLVLDGVQDPHNLGACLRSANAFGVTAVICPKDRSVGMTPVVRKVACGAAMATPVIAVTNLARTLRWLKEQGVWLVGTSDRAEMTLNEVDLAGPIALVMGGEENGMRRLTEDHCDFIAKIPIGGVVSSLNVSVAAGVCLYEISRQRGFN
jgi:23S rRNA (guanosine2251-2'-O)-methyltransferase